ncbi:HEPN domain-containing protein [Solicola gregarius]|uniref:HEPN domain-containing protein n=1 Tax=Solicola gregarius TaxID=2908642 RepID=A0AA46TK27_9ACTN|nr:HEPN domain-containing protein [Solicola gregarius]UYM06334.1 HEPN domain-containing protein [Solicola gregarius]
MSSTDNRPTETAPGGPNDEFAANVLDQMRTVFWEPEVARRGGESVTGPVLRALAVLHPGQPVEVRFNNEFELMARSRVGSPVQPGDAVEVANVEDVEALEPVGVDPNAGWVVWVVLPDGREYAQFDFTRNRGRSLKMLRLADDYLTTAQRALEAGYIGPSVENALAAAELAITAQTYSLATEEPPMGGRRNSHSARQHWTKVQVGLGNTTPDAHETLIVLNGLRGASRYGEGDIPSAERAASLVATVRSMVEDAETRVGQLMRTQDPEFLDMIAGRGYTAGEAP